MTTPRTSYLSAMIVAFALATVAGAYGQNQRLPQSAPVPKPAPESGAKAVAPEPGELPVPQPRPAAAGGTSQPAPMPDEKVFSDPAGQLRATTDGDEASCRARLKTLGVAFHDVSPLSDPEGCSVPHPLSVASLGATVALNPPAIVNCQTAEAVARFVQGTIAPAVHSAFKTDLASIENASAYVCRPRNGTGKLSEHAFGNALDIAAFELGDKRRIDVRKTADDVEANFLAAIRAAACGPFKTVLGPGNPDHDTHFHLDLQPRRNGGTYCR